MKNLLFFSLVVILTTFAISIGINFSFTTADDSLLVPTYLEHQSKSQVLGASTKKETSPLCPDSKPIAGWIDFQGVKKLQNPPKGENPSACFSTEQEAISEGYTY
jgi:hypothetical protein